MLASALRSLKIWSNIKRGKLLSLLDMLTIFASEWNGMLRELEQLNVALNLKILDAMAEGPKDAVLLPLRNVESVCHKIGLGLSRVYAARLIAEIEGTPTLKEQGEEFQKEAIMALNHLKEGTPHAANLSSNLRFVNVQERAKILRERIDDELAQVEIFVVDPSERTYVLGKNLFGDDVDNKFPSAKVDIEEAGKCRAFGRSTACVFHLMRVMEVGLKAASRALGIPYAHSWESHLNQINAKVTQRHKHKGIRWKRDEAFFKDVAAHLQTVKLAWRNPTMHIVRTYREDEAREVYESVRTLMRHLATRLKEVR